MESHSRTFAHVAWPLVILVLVAGCPNAPTTPRDEDAGPRGIGVLPSREDPRIIGDDDALVGELTSVRAEAVAAVDGRRAVCDSQPCPSALSNDETCCAERAECVEGQCELIGPRGATLGEGCAP